MLWWMEVVMDVVVDGSCCDDGWMDVVVDVVVMDVLMDVVMGC